MNRIGWSLTVLAAVASAALVAGVVGSMLQFEVITTVPHAQASGYVLDRHTGQVQFWQCVGIGKAGGCEVNSLRLE